MEHRLHSCEVFHNKGKNVSKSEEKTVDRGGVKKHSIKVEQLKSGKFEVFRLSKDTVEEWIDIP